MSSNQGDPTTDRDGLPRTTLVTLVLTPEDRDAWLAAVPEPPVDNVFDSKTMLRALRSEEPPEPA